MPLPGRTVPVIAVRKGTFTPRNTRHTRHTGKNADAVVDRQVVVGVVELRFVVAGGVDARASRWPRRRCSCWRPARPRRCRPDGLPRSLDRSLGWCRRRDRLTSSRPRRGPGARPGRRPGGRQAHGRH
jgi:hypothetical protein